MDANSIIILGLCVVLLIALVLMYIKDKQTEKKFDRFDHIMTDNMNEIFALKKEISLLKEKLENGEFEALFGEKERSENELDIAKVDERVDEKLVPIIKTLRQLHQLIKSK